MDRLLVSVDKADFEAFVADFPSQREAIDFLSLKVDQTIRARRRARPQNPMVDIEIPLNPGRLAVFNEYCTHFKLTRTDVIGRLIRRKPNPRK